LVIVNAFQQVKGYLVGNYGIILIVRVRDNEITDHSSPSFEFSLSSCNQEASIESYLLYLILGVLAVYHELFNKRQDSLELDLWFSLEDLPDIKFFKDEGGFFIDQYLLALSRYHCIDASFSLLTCQVKLLAIFI